MEYKINMPPHQQGLNEIQINLASLSSEGGEPYMFISESDQYASEENYDYF